MAAAAAEIPAAPAQPAAAPAAQAAPQAAPAAVAAPTTVAEWFLADGVKGTGERPDYYKADKYKTLAEQARAYPDAEKKIGELTTQLKGLTPQEAPAEYKLPDLAELGGDMDWNKDDPLLKKAFETAKAHKMSQATFDAFAKDVMVPMIRHYELLDIGQEKTLMGERADERLNSVTDWAKRNLNEEQFAIVNATLGKWSRPHEVFKAFEAILQASKQAQAPKPGDDVRTGTLTVEEINRKYRTPDATTKLALIDTPDGLAKYRAELAQVVGTGNHIEIVGKR